MAYVKSEKATRSGEIMLSDEYDEYEKKGLLVEVGIKEMK